MYPTPTILALSAVVLDHGAAIPQPLDSGYLVKDPVDNPSNPNPQLTRFLVLTVADWYVLKRDPSLRRG